MEKTYIDAFIEIQKDNHRETQETLKDLCNELKRYNAALQDHKLEDEKIASKVRLMTWIGSTIGAATLVSVVTLMIKALSE